MGNSTQSSQDGDRRFVVIGTSGSGKTTLARAIAQRLEIPHIELDALHWGPSWTGASPAQMAAKVEAATMAPSWAMDGNYSKVRALVWSKATHIVWLDYAFTLVFWRVLVRTLRRSLTREVLWNGNRESLRLTFLSRDSLLLWVITTYRRRRREYPALFCRPEYSHLSVIRLPTPDAAQSWLEETL